MRCLVVLACVLCLPLSASAGNLKDTDLIASNTFFLPSSTNKTVFVQARNSSDNQGVSFHDLVSRLTAKGYEVVQDHSAAHYIVLANIVYCNITKPEMPVGAMVADGYGSGLGSMMLSGLQGPSGMAGMAGPQGAMAGAAAAMGLDAIEGIGSAVGSLFSSSNLGRVTENKIQKILESMGTIISEGTISNIMFEEKREEFPAEKNAIFKTGMENADYFQIDDTGARHAGKNHYLDVVCNDQFGSFFILGGKSTYDLRPIFGLKEGEQIDKPMVSDAAQQFHSISSKQGLCWIHEIRHFRKLTPVLEQHRTLLSGFIDRLWHYYELLEDFKENPDCGFGVYLEWLFDFIFLPTAKTGYVMMDETIASTRKRKDRLLKVLIYPELPLHNNGSEIAVREGVIKRKIRYGTRSESGKAAWENQLTILDTCRKQRVSYFNALADSTDAWVPL